MSPRHPDVTAFIARQGRFQAELTALRALLLQTELVETLKWRQPCYTHNGGNVVMIYALKDTVAMGFLKGVLLPDPEGNLRAPGANSQSSRWIGVEGVADIAARRDILLAYINAAIAVADAGLKVAFPQKDALVYPNEWLNSH